MVTVNEIFAFLCALAPLELQMDFDNAGFLLGRSAAPVKRALLSLDVTSEVAYEAAELKADLIISHHPVIFSPIKNLSDASPEGSKLLFLAENHIAVISMHTNMDIAQGGVNDVLIAALGAKAEAPLDEYGCGRVGVLPGEKNMVEFLPVCKNALDTSGLKYYDSGRPVRRLAVMGGAGGDCVRLAYERGCDTYVTSDVKYHQFLEAKELGLNLIDADHYGTENPFIPALARELASAFPQVEFIISQRHKQPLSFF